MKSLIHSLLATVASLAALPLAFDTNVQTLVPTQRVGNSRDRR